MAKKSMIARDVKRTKAVARDTEKRSALKAIVASPDSSFEEKWNAMQSLQKMPRDGSPARQRNRCFITGRPHGYYRKFGLSRNKLRELIMRGDVPGVVKSSW